MSWVDSDQLIYGVDDEGLYEAHLNSPKHVLLQPVEEKYVRQISISPDQTRVLYAAAKDEYGHDTHYYLYDIQKKKSVAIPGLRTHSVLGQLVFVGFSPDSKSLLWQDNGGFEDPPDKVSAVDLILYRAEDLQRTEFRFPFGVGPERTRSCFPSQWSSDGRFVYGNYINSRFFCALDDQGKHPVTRFKVDITNGAVTYVDGGYEFDKHKYRFTNYYVDGGQRLDLAYRCNWHKYCAFGDPLVAGNHEAQLVSSDEGNGVYKQDLTITSNQQAEIIDTGHESFCAGSNIGLVSWVKGKYLVYTLDGTTYVYGVDERRKSALPQLTGTYNWLPAAATRFIYSQGGNKESIMPAQADY